MNVTWVAASISPTETVTHLCSALTVVTDDCHTNTTLVSHIAKYSKGCRASLTIWINDVISAYTADLLSNYITGSNCNRRIYFDFGFYFCKSIGGPTSVRSLVDFLMLVRTFEETETDDIPSFVQVIEGLKKLSATHRKRSVEPMKGVTVRGGRSLNRRGEKTIRWAVCDADPRIFSALQMYIPLSFFVTL